SARAIARRGAEAFMALADAVERERGSSQLRFSIVMIFLDFPENPNLGPVATQRLEEGELALSVGKEKPDTAAAHPLQFHDARPDCRERRQAFDFGRGPIGSPEHGDGPNARGLPRSPKTRQPPRRRHP